MGKGKAAAVVVSLERGFQGENLSLWTAGDSGLVDHLQFQQVGEQDGLVAFTAASAESKGTAVNVVLCTTSFAHLSLATNAALVHGVGHHGTTPTKLSAQLTIVDGSELDVAQSERALPAGRRAIAGAQAP